MDRVVFVNGCFDLLHFGHVSFLKRAAAYGDSLVVGINSDSSVRSIKGPSRPIMSESERRSSLLILDFVDDVRIFEKSNPGELIRELRPDVIVKSTLYRDKPFPEREVIEALECELIFIDTEEKISTTVLIDRIRKFQGTSG